MGCGKTQPSNGPVLVCGSPGEANGPTGALTRPRLNRRGHNSAHRININERCLRAAKRKIRLEPGLMSCRVFARHIEALRRSGSRGGGGGANELCLSPRSNVVKRDPGHFVSIDRSVMMQDSDRHDSSCLYTPAGPLAPPKQPRFSLANNTPNRSRLA